MQAQLRNEFQRLMDELARRDIEIGDDARRSIEDQFERAEPAFLNDPHGAAELAANTDAIVRHLAEATDHLSVPGGGGWDAGPADGAGPAVERESESVRYLTADGVDTAFKADCLWPWCP